jgi:uncharacterized membrane protein
MDLRPALYDLSAHYDLDAGASRKLHQLAGLDKEPQQLRAMLPRGLAVLAAVLCGLGVIFWVAANWELLSRTSRFALLQGVFFASCAGALYIKAARVPLALLSFFSIGGLFAFFGQTYQTGADPWQLFALWAALGLPICLAVRSEVLWAPWALVSMGAISLWVQAHTGHSWWRFDAGDFAAYMIGWTAALLVTLALSPVFASFTGARAWSMRISLTLAVFNIGLTALMGLFAQETAGQYYLGLTLLAGMAAAFATRQLFDVFVLSTVGIALNGLMVGGIVRFIKIDDIGVLFFIGIVAACLLSGTVSMIMKLSRSHSAVEAST